MAGVEFRPDLAAFVLGGVRGRPLPPPASILDCRDDDDDDDPPSLNDDAVASPSRAKEDDGGFIVRALLGLSEKFNNYCPTPLNYPSLGLPTLVLGPATCTSASLSSSMHQRPPASILDWVS